MQRILFILLGIAVTTTVLGLLFAFSRPIRWPANVASPAWRRAFGESAEEPVEEEVVA